MAPSWWAAMAWSSTFGAAATSMRQAVSMRRRGDVWNMGKSMEKGVN